MRVIGFANLMLTVNNPNTAAILYVVMAATLAAGFYAISRGLIIAPPEFAGRRINDLSDWFLRRAGAVVGTRQ
jgi:hypothetical protein